MPSPIIVPTGSGIAAGILRPVYRRALGAQLGPFQTLATTALATSGEARRHVLSSGLIDDEDERERLKGRYLYVATGDMAGHQARILSTGYHGGAGLLEVSRPFATALPTGTTVEISSPLPCEQFLDTRGLNQIVNEALERCDIEYRLALTGNGTRSLSLTDYEGFLDESNRIDALYDTTAYAAGQPLEPSPYSARVDATGAARTLVTDYTYASGQALEVRVIRAGHTLVKSGGAWGTSSVGLTSDDQAAAVPLRWVVAAGMGKALQAWERIVRQDATMSAQDKAPILDDIANGPNGLRYWRGVFARIAREQFPQPTAKRRASHPYPLSYVADPWSLP